MEILFCRHDLVDPDPDIQFWRLSDGDVYCVRDDNHPWGTRELTSPNLRIVRNANITHEFAESFEEWDWTGKNPEVDEKPTNIRKYTLNKTSPALTQAFVDFWDDDTRANPIYTSVLPLVTLLGLRSNK